MENVLILGAKGMLGSQLRKLFSNAVCWDREDVDVTDFEALQLKIEALAPRPLAIINCVAYNDVDGAEQNKELAFKLNAQVPGELARMCSRLGIVLVHFSSNYVFGNGRGEYAENDKPAPAGVYAESKYQGELEIQKQSASSYLIRTAVLFGTKGESELSKKSFIDLVLEKSAETDTIQAVEDEVNSITYVTDLAGRVHELLVQHSPYGTYHITNSGSASWFDFAKEIFAILQKPVLVTPVSASSFARAAVRPKKSVLINTKLAPMRPWQDALKEFLTT